MLVPSRPPELKPEPPVGEGGGGGELLLLWCWKINTMMMTSTASTITDKRDARRQFIGVSSPTLDVQYPVENHDGEDGGQVAVRVPE